MLTQLGALGVRVDSSNGRSQKGLRPQIRKWTLTPITQKMDSDPNYPRSCRHRATPLRVGTVLLSAAGEVGRVDRTFAHPTSSKDALRLCLDHHALGEDFLDLGVAVGDALLVHIAQELLKGWAVLLDAERERIAPEHVAHAARIDRQPR